MESFSRHHTLISSALTIRWTEYGHNELEVGRCRRSRGNMPRVMNRAMKSALSQFYVLSRPSEQRESGGQNGETYSSPAISGIHALDTWIQFPIINI